MSASIFFSTSSFVRQSRISEPVKIPLNIVSVFATRVPPSPVGFVSVLRFLFQKALNQFLFSQAGLFSPGASAEKSPGLEVKHSGLEQFFDIIDTLSDAFGLE
jgi:hypothetical protein